jgi:signal transduction histidine kinase
MSDVRGLSLGILLVLAVAVVLVFAARSLDKERRRLLLDFADAQEAVARDLATSVEDKLLDTEEDARVIATMVHAAHEAAPPGADPSARSLGASFSATATVVRHYKSLALFSGGGDLKVSAADPAEPPALAEAYLRVSRTAVAREGAHAGPTLTGPFEAAPGRFVYLYAFAVDHDVVVITIDAPRLVQTALRPAPNARSLVIDPSGKAWAPCAPGAACTPRALESHDAPLVRDPAPAGALWLTTADATARGLPDSTAVATWATATGGPHHLGPWRVLLVSSASALDAREQSLVRQLGLTVAGLLAAIGVVGALIVRQQRYSAALSERLKSAETLRSLEGQLIRAEKLATTGVLAAGIAHEVGTPLGIIRARAELLGDDLASPGGRRALEAIIQQIDRIAGTIRQVLDFSRSQAVQVSPVDAGTALHAVAELLDHRFKQDDLRFTTSVEPHLPPIAADPNQLQQVLVNLLMNACDACARGAAIHVDVAPSDDGGFVEWTVRDHGSGIAQEHLLAVFDPFFTTKKRGEGTGLGLPVAAGIVRNHGGDIALTSAPGLGTTITIRWPVFNPKVEARHGQG